jgi:hypothetical protein
MDQQCSNRSLLVICYPQGWHWGLSIEFLNSELMAGKYYDVIDASFVGENLFLVKFKKFLGKYKFYKESIYFLANSNVRIINFNKWIYKGNKDNKTALIHKPITLSPAYNTIIESYGSMNLQKIKRSIRGLRIIHKEIRTSNKMYSQLSRLNIHDYQKIVTVNGRFNKNSTVIKWCKTNGLKHNIVEFGTLTKNTFEIYEISPHSMIEAQTKIEKYWHVSNDSFKIQKANTYFDNMIKGKASSGINFREKMIDGKVPIFSDKKICVYFASSEYEYAGINEEIESGKFVSQVEAFRGLLDVLNPNEWDVYLRRHPQKNGNKKFDGEKFLWKEFYGKSNICIIEPDSDIDSISLGISADLIVTFWSTINMEFLARGHQNAINLGPTAWNRLVPSRYLSNRSEISSFIAGQQQPVSIKDVLPWAYFMSSFGKEFQIISSDAISGEWYFNY